MSLVNKENDMTPFDMTEKPVKQFLPLVWLLWGASFILTRNMSVEKIGMKGLKPPFLVLSTHQGFSDYFIAPRILFPLSANYISDMEGFAAYGKLMYKHGGCIGKRRYVPDVSVIKNIKYALYELKQPVVIFPESRHSDCGVTSQLPSNLGRLVKYLDVPLVILSAHGSYLANPFWDEERTRKIKMSARIEKVYSAEEIRSLTAAEIQKTIEEKLSYDEYRWQLDNKIKIDFKYRAEGLHKPLYKCIKCEAEGSMKSEGIRLSCGCCKSVWEMSELGFLEDVETHKTYHITDWYNWERDEAEKEIIEQRYSGIDIPVVIEALPNEKGFIKLGSGRLQHSTEGYRLYVNENENHVVKSLTNSFPLSFSSRNMQSVQTEYNYRKKGKCIVLSTKDCCYYVYSSSPDFIVTKLEFITEYLYQNSNKNK